jgi:hypothetical protein
MENNMEYGDLGNAGRCVVLLEAQIKVYVDTCVLSDTTDSRDVINEATIDAIDLICDNANIDLVTSKKTLEEF